MNIKEAILLRHSVRQYEPGPLAPQQVELLQAKIKELNESYGLSMQLVLNDNEAFNSRMAHYGSFRGVENFVAVVGTKGKKKVAFAADKEPREVSLEERAGYALSQLVLLSQTLGLNTCIAALTFKKTSNIKIEPGQTVVVAIAIGKGVSQGHSHPAKPATRIAPGYEASPEWFKRGIDTVLFAPSAVNQFRAVFTLGEDGVVSAKARLGVCTKVDLGIFKFYFEQGAGIENFRWE